MYLNPKDLYFDNPKQAAESGVARGKALSLVTELRSSSIINGFD